MKKVFYEVWGWDDDEAELSLYFKFPVPNPDDPKSDEETKEFAQKAADELTDQDVRRTEVRRVEE